MEQKDLNPIHNNSIIKKVEKNKKLFRVRDVEVKKVGSKVNQVDDNFKVLTNSSGNVMFEKQRVVVN